MPELPEVETVRRGLAPVMEGARFERVEARRGDLRWPLPKDFVKRLEGQTVTGLGRRAKYILADLSSGEVLLMHLGMSGSFRVVRAGTEETPGDFHHERSKAAAHDHIVFHLERDGAITYNDPRRFGFMLLIPGAELNEHPLLRALGVEPLSRELTPEYLARRARGKKVALKPFLADQRIVAGVGNIYACEALFRARIDPRKAAGTVSRPALARLVPAIREVLEQAIGDGGSTLRDYAQPDGELGYFATRFAVYDREGQPCARDDGGVIRRIVQGGRSTWFCPKCQK